MQSGAALCPRLRPNHLTWGGRVFARSLKPLGKSSVGGNVFQDRRLRPLGHLSASGNRALRGYRGSGLSNTRDMNTKGHRTPISRRTWRFTQMAKIRYRLGARFQPSPCRPRSRLLSLLDPTTNQIGDAAPIGLVGVEVILGVV